MNSSSFSDSHPSVTIENLDIDYNIDIHRPCTFRDSFVNFVSHPIRSLSASKDRLRVLNDVNLKIFPGDRLGILGVNGSGKTSLCRAIAGFYIPRTGEVQTTGKVRAIFDTSVGILPELTGRENAELLIELLFPELTPPEKNRLLADALSFSELGQFVDAPFQSYSKGMQARLCLSVISSKGSDVLILDEVFDGADQFFREKISQRVLKMIEESGAVIFVSHISGQIEKVCNRLIVLNDGRIVFDGDVAEGVKLYDNLSN